jgi:pimeloyl-ACP methyl ester carboxylesterase
VTCLAEVDLKKAAQSETELSMALAEKYKDYKGVTSTWILFFARCLWRLDPNFFHSLLHDFNSFAKGYDYKQILARINCPILCIRGETNLGAVMSDDEIAWLKNHFTNVRSVQIQGVGHLLHLQDQGQTPVLTEMMAFLEHI